MSRKREIRNVVRPDATGRPDDIVLSCDTVHLERMNDHAWWMGIYRGDPKKGERIVLHFSISKKGKLRVWVDNESHWPIVDDRGEYKVYNPSHKVVKRLREQSALPEEADALAKALAEGTFSQSPPSFRITPTSIPTSLDSDTAP